MQLLTLNAAGQALAPPVALDPKRRRLSQVVGRHVDRRRPHMIAVQRARDPLQPMEEAWVTRGRDRAGNVRPWPRMYLPADAIVVVVYLPRGGGGASAGGRSGKSSVLSIATAVAAIALVAFGQPYAIALLGPGLGSVAIAGLAVGISALGGLASRSKANKQATDTTQIYGVAGGGNAPKSGDRIPRAYGRSWLKPDLSQPDFSQYDGDDQILFKRHTVGLGRYRAHQIRAGKQVIWTEAGGWQAPFDDARNAVEFVYGTASTLVPSNVVSASGVGGMLPRPNDTPSYAGPFLINQRGALVTRLQVDFQFPQGISRTHYFRSGQVQANQPGEWSVVFQYAPIDASGAVVGPWVDLYNSNSGVEGARFATHPLRYTKFKDVPAGRYAVRAWNITLDTSGNTTGDAQVNACQWDGAAGWVADAAIRPGITEMAMRVYATKASQAAAFGEIEIDAAAVIPVWTGSGWEDRETSKAVWAFLDILRDQDYGGGLPEAQIDLGTAKGYADRLGEFDTFDGTIRGPVSVYEAAATVLLPMRAEPVHTGRYWSLVRDEPKAVRRHVITRRQILKGTTQVSFDLDLAAGAGHVIGEFDQDGDYRNPNQTTAIYGEASLTPTRQRWTGVRTFAHAQHLTRWRAASGAFRRQSTPFGVEMEGRIYRRGDSVAVDQWFIDARKVAGVVDNVGDTLRLDADVPLVATDWITLRDRAGREWGPLALLGQGATPREVRLNPQARAQVEAATGVSLAQALSDGRRDMTTAVFGALTTLQENYLIQSVKPSGADRAQVEALIDDARVWDAIGAPIAVPPTGYGGLTDPESPSILGLTGSVVQLVAGLRLDFAIQPGRGATRFEVGFSYDGGSHYVTIYEGTATTGQASLNPVDPTVGRLRARAFGATGLPGRYFYAALNLPRSGIASDELEDRFAEVQTIVNDVARRGDEELARGIALLLDVNRDLDERLEGLAQAAATEAGNAYDTRELHKVALEGRAQDNFAAILEETRLRVSDTQSLTSITTTLGSKLTTAEGRITGTATALQSLTSDVTNIDGRVTSQASSITSLRSTLTDQGYQISEQATATQQLTTRVSAAEGSITSQASAITALQSTVSGQGGQISGQATAISNLSTRASNADNRLDITASNITALNTSLGANSATLSVVSQSVDGVKVQFGVTGNIDGSVGGFVLTGARRLDGGADYGMYIRANVVVDGGVTARSLAAQQLILNGQIFDGAVSSMVAADSGGVSSTAVLSVNRRNGSTRVAILAVFDQVSSGASFPNAAAAGQFQIVINGGVHVAKNASVFVAGSNNNVYLTSDAILHQIDLGNGTYNIEARHTNGGGQGRSKILVIEISK